MITRNHIDYLRGLVQKEITWREGILDRFEVRPGQSDQEASKAKARIERALDYSERVLTELDRLHERALALDKKANGE